MASVTVTVSTIDGVTPANSLQSLDSKDIVGFTSSDNLTTGTAVLKVLRYKSRARGYVPKEEKWVCSQSYATVQAAINAADAEAGAQLTAEKDASGGYAGLTLLKINFKNALNTFTSFFTNSNTAARTYTFQDRDGTIADDTDLATKQSTSGKDATGGYAGLTLFKINFKNAANTFTSFFTNANTAARTYTFQDRDGTIADDTDLALKAPLASPTFTGPVIIETEAAASNNTRAASTAFVQGEFTAKIAKIASGALTAGVRTINDAAIQATSIVTVQRIVTGGTAAVGGYKVTINAGVSVVITALQVDCVTTETSCTDTVMGLIYY